MSSCTHSVAYDTKTIMTGLTIKLRAGAFIPIPDLSWWPVNSVLLKESYWTSICALAWVCFRDLWHFYWANYSPVPYLWFLFQCVLWSQLSQFFRLLIKHLGFSMQPKVRCLAWTLYGFFLPCPFKCKPVVSPTLKSIRPLRHGRFK